MSHGMSGITSKQNRNKTLDPKAKKKKIINIKPIYAG